MHKTDQLMFSTRITLCALLFFNGCIMPQLIAGGKPAKSLCYERASTAACVAVAVLCAAGGAFGGVFYRLGSIGGDQNPLGEKHDAIPVRTVVIGDSAFPDMGCNVRTVARIYSDGTLEANATSQERCSYVTGLGRAGSCSVVTEINGACKTQMAPWAPRIVIGDGAGSKCKVRCLGLTSAHSPDEPGMWCDSPWACDSYTEPGTACEVTEDEFDGYSCSFTSEESE